MIVIVCMPVCCNQQINQLEERRGATHYANGRGRIPTMCNVDISLHRANGALLEKHAHASHPSPLDLDLIRDWPAYPLAGLSATRWVCLRVPPALAGTAYLLPELHGNRLFLQ